MERKSIKTLIRLSCGSLRHLNPSGIMRQKGEYFNFPTLKCSSSPGFLSVHRALISPDYTSRGFFPARVSFTMKKGPDSLNLRPYYVEVLPFPGVHCYPFFHPQETAKLIALALRGEYNSDSPYGFVSAYSSPIFGFGDEIEVEKGIKVGLWDSPAFIGGGYEKLWGVWNIKNIPPAPPYPEGFLNIPEIEEGMTG